MRGFPGCHCAEVLGKTRYGTAARRLRVELAAADGVSPFSMPRRDADRM
jgi:hypothetical protein